MFAQLILRYCMCSAFETNTSDKNCIQLSLIWDQAELSSSTERSAMRFSFVAVINKHTVNNLVQRQDVPKTVFIVTFQQGLHQFVTLWSV